MSCAVACLPSAFVVAGRRVYSRRVRYQFIHMHTSLHDKSSGRMLGPAEAPQPVMNCTAIQILPGGARYIRLLYTRKLGFSSAHCVQRSDQRPSRSAG